MAFYIAYTKEYRRSEWLLKRENPSGVMQYRERYADLVCPKCRKLDEITAFQRGVEDDVRIHTRRDVLETLDGWLLLSAKGRTALETIPGSLLDFHALPGDSHYVVALPRQRFPWWERPGFRAGRPCSECGIYREVKWGNVLKASSFKPFWPSTVVAGYLILQGWFTWSPQLLLNDVAVTSLQSANLSGWDYFDAIPATV